ncbi:unnamed protein product [Cuscuta campestris]|uniref:Glycine-rich protein n=1 Tax=Cuscuta campestris TaxID=132261 RepID=A0A484NB75_9ASTE|nr:unnamed protein product [Cuscuta campestris]
MLVFCTVCLLVTSGGAKGGGGGGFRGGLRGAGGGWGRGSATPITGGGTRGWRNGNGARAFPVVPHIGNHQSSGAAGRLSSAAIGVTTAALFFSLCGFL